MTQAEQEQLRTVWSERVTAYQASDAKSIRGWCGEQGIPEHQMYYWMRKLRHTQQHNESRVSRWVELSAGESCRATSSSGVSLRIGHAVVEIQRHFDPQVLADVVRSLVDHAE